MASELTLGPIPYQAGSLSAASIQYGGFCRLTDTVFFTIFRQTTPSYVYAQILTTPNIKSSTATFTLARGQRILEIPTNSLYTAAFDCVRLSDNYVIVFGKQSAAVNAVEIRIFWINPDMDPDHRYVIRQVGQPILIDDINVIAGTGGSRPYLLPSIVDNVCWFEYQQSTSQTVAAHTRVLKRLQFTPTTGEVVIKLITTIGAAAANLPYAIPHFAKQPTSNHWVGCWVYSNGTTALFNMVTVPFDPMSDLPVAPVVVTGAAGVGRSLTALTYNTVYMPQSDGRGIIFNGTSVDYDTVTNGVCTGVKKQVGDTTLVGTTNYSVMGWWTDPTSFITLTINTALVALYPTTQSWKLSSSTTCVPLIRVHTYTNDSNIAITHGTATKSSQFNTANTLDYNSLYLYPYKTEIFGGDTMLLYGYNTAIPARWFVKAVELA